MSHWVDGEPREYGLFVLEYGDGRTVLHRSCTGSVYSGVRRHFKVDDPPPPAPVLPPRLRQFTGWFGCQIIGTYIPREKAPFVIWFWQADKQQYEMMGTCVEYAAEIRDFKWLDDESGNPLGSEGGNG